MKNFLPFLLIKAVLTAALFGGIPGVHTRGILRARADWVYETIDDFSILDHNLLYISKEEDLREEIYGAYKSDPAAAAYTGYSPTYISVIDPIYDPGGITTHGGDITFGGSMYCLNEGYYSGYIDVSGGTMQIHAQDFPRVFNITFISGAEPPDEPEESRTLIFVSEGSSYTITFNTFIDTSGYFLSSIQVYEDTRDKVAYADFITWSNYENASPFPYFKDSLSFTVTRRTTIYVPQNVYIQNVDPSYFYNAPVVIMNGRSVGIYSADRTASAAITTSPARDWTIFFNDAIEESYIAWIPTEQPANLNNAIAFSNGTSVLITQGSLEELEFQTSVIFTSTTLEWRIGAEGYGTGTRCKLGPLTDTDVQDSAQAFNLFRYCCTAVISRWEEPEPEPETEEEGFKLESDWKTISGAITTIGSALFSMIATPAYIVPAVLAGIGLEIQQIGQPSEEEIFVANISAIFKGIGRGLDLWVEFFETTWNSAFDVIAPVAKAIFGLLDLAFGFVVKLAEEIIPRIAPFFQRVFEFIGNYWYVILPAGLAIFLSVKIFNNSKRR